MTTTTATDDVGRISGAGDGAGAGASATTFAQLPLRAELQRALRRMRFHAPSPIQLRALPLALFGTDVIGQAKSGTGKTAVFGLAAVEHVLQRGVAQAPAGLVPSDPLALILAPTREIAMQIDAVLRQLAAESDSVRIVPLIGGLPVAQDQKRLRAGCHIAVGTPGRVRWLMEDGMFRPKSIRLLVFDEVDKLLSGEFVEDIDAIVAAIPSRRQTLAFSATFTPDQLVHVVSMMRDPQVVRVRIPGDVTVELVPSREDQLTAWIEREKQHEPELWLRHVRQFYRVVPQANDRATVGGDPLQLKQKLVLLASLLSEIAFHQCIVFCNDKFRAEALATALASQGWPAAAITGAQPQTTRNAVMDQFRAVALRVLVSTDLTARGIDVDRVNFVVNLDLPRDPATYLHRVGRTGRFGGKIREAFVLMLVADCHGLAVTLLTENEVEGVRLLRRVFKMAVDELPTPAPRDVRRYVVVDTGDDSATHEEQSVAAPTPTDETDVEETCDTTDDHAVTTGDDVEEAHRRAEVWSAKSDVEEGGSDCLAPLKEEEEEARSTSSETGVVLRADDASASRRHGADDGAPASPSSEPTRRQHASVGADVAVSWEEQCYTQWLRLL